MGSVMDMESLFDKISQNAPSYSHIVKKTLRSLCFGVAEAESSISELALTATLLINEICSYNDLPSIYFDDGSLYTPEKGQSNTKSNGNIPSSPQGTMEKGLFHDAGAELPSMVKYLCHECKSILPSHKEVLNHCISSHPGLRVPILKLLAGGSHPEVASGGPQDSAHLCFTCAHCEKNFFFEEALKEHIYLKHQTTGESKVLRHKQRRKEKRFKCSRCTKKFSNRSILRNHVLNIHEGKKAFCCEQCGKCFSCKANLQLHISRHHRKRTLFICEICGKGLLNKATLKEHVLYVHEKVPHIKKYSCEDCDKKFRLKRQLVKHVDDHHKGKS